MNIDATLPALSETPRRTAPAPTEWRREPTEAIIRYLMKSHHDWLREALPRIEHGFQLVLDEHGREHGVVKTLLLPICNVFHLKRLFSSFFRIGVIFCLNKRFKAIIKRLRVKRRNIIAVLVRRRVRFKIMRKRSRKPFYKLRRRTVINGSTRQKRICITERVCAIRQLVKVVAR